MKVSKLDIKKYRWAPPKRWVKFAHPEQTEIDPVFEGRLAALGAHLGLVINIIRGAVTAVEQKAVGERLLKQNPTWTRRQNGAIYNPKGQCMVAAPGTSPHEQALAVDGDVRLEAVANNVLARFGLCRPMAYEPWHIQPIETRGLNFTNRERFRPMEIPGTIAENQARIGLAPDNIYGPKTDEALKNELF